jgi:hypothetical protein
VETVPDLFIDPKTTFTFLEMRLNEWYGPLGPGMYRLTNRERFEINGPWTAESEALSFEIRTK